jgi:hypothetical protein
LNLGIVGCAKLFAEAGYTFARGGINSPDAVVARRWNESLGDRGD